MVSEAEAAPAWLRAEGGTLAWCWRLSRRDGVVLGLTSHDRDLLIDGVLYRAAPGMKPSAIETSDSLDASTMDLEGAISSDAIAARDLDAGRWDGDLAPLTRARRIVAIDGRQVTIDAAPPPGTMAFGELCWLEGAACGLRTPVIAAAGAVLTLAEMPPLLPPLPARVRLIEGCDKQLATCRSRFANAVNFRGEAHLPGNDLLTRYPGG